MLELLVKTREGTGRKNKKIREQGFIPAVLYGREVENLLLSVNGQDFKKIYEKVGASVLVNLKISNGGKEDERVVLVQDTAKDVVNGKIIHIDFNQIKMDEETEVEVPLIFVGESIAVEREGGVLVKNIQSIEVKALPQNLPKQIEADISIIKSFDNSIRVKDLKIPENVKVTASLEDIVASVVPPRTSEELEELKQAPTEKIEEVEVEKKGKEAQEEIQEETQEKDGSAPKEKPSASGGGGNE